MCTRGVVLPFFFILSKPYICINKIYKKNMRQKEENEMKKKEKRGLLLEGALILGGIFALIYLKKKNGALKRELYNLEGQVQNQNDLIRGYQKMVERDAFAKGKFDRQHGINLKK